MDEQSKAAYEKLKEHSIAVEEKAKELQHQQDIEEAKRVMSQVEKVGTVPVQGDFQKVEPTPRAKTEAVPREFQQSASRGGAKTFAEASVERARADARAAGVNGVPTK